MVSTVSSDTAQQTSAGDFKIFLLVDYLRAAKFSSLQTGNCHQGFGIFDWTSSVIKLPDGVER